MKNIIKPFVAFKEKVNSGEDLVVTSSIIKTRKRMVFTADIESLSGGKLYLCHGYMKDNASWIELSDTSVGAYTYFSYTNPQKKELLGGDVDHGITIGRFLTVSIDYEPKKLAATLIIASSGGMFKTELPGWCGNEGEIFAKFDGVDAENCKLSWTCDDYSRKIWLIGDSYIGFGHGARWPYYLFRDGYTNVMLVGYPGMSSERGIKEFAEIVDHGEPEIVVWALGMNNMDDSEDNSFNGINKGYLESTKEFIRICEERGITPILSTIPNVPERSNRAKNAWVRSLPYRYIDFARAVGSDKNPEWYGDMLCQDRVHPATKGAEALYSQVLADFPEIMQAE